VSRNITVSDNVGAGLDTLEELLLLLEISACPKFPIFCCVTKGSGRGVARVATRELDRVCAIYEAILLIGYYSHVLPFFQEV